MEHIKSIKTGHLTCDCAYAATPRICYVLTPILLDKKRLEQWCNIYETTIVSVHGIDWDNDLTPWVAPGVEANDADFEGKAFDFLSFLRTTVLPKVETSPHGQPPTERTLVGISLSGLFAVWAWMNGDDFTHIGSISGSFWYDGFTEWLELYVGKSCKQGHAYFSLGDKEGIRGNPRYQTVVTDTDCVIRTLRKSGISAQFEMTGGTHFAPIYPSMEKAFNYLLKSMQL